MVQPRGFFFSFDGVDGVGKSTQLELFGRYLEETGHEVVICRDPGSTAAGEQIREMLLDASGTTPIGRRCETFLYMAARAQMVEQVIAPALAAGRTVVSDRFLLANVVYQGYGGGLDVDLLWQIGRLATQDIEPDLTFLLDMSSEAAQTRLQRPLDRLEQQGDAFASRIRAGFLTEAGRHARIALIDADRPIDVVQAEIRQCAEKIFANR